MVWLAGYGFKCVMLTYYPDSGKPFVPINVSEGTVDWKASIQAIRNLIGAFSASAMQFSLVSLCSHYFLDPKLPRRYPITDALSLAKSAPPSTSAILPSSLSPSSDPSCAPKPKPSPPPS
ncbi:hypothetical protein HYDPIDRAFT_43445 [Hydnomerulius pinastri MD-312]|uniref:Uncharacterized protein n=1 Tax=Hydnomerulius pinastri MD-312 TaxID=994086 RepID=A0A0C9WAK5_9AGAM|nr:hypothetical protein HYDPIDRAFT_43445 [Hydnomerulius pinastri MD-312]